ncbi:MAG: hypothetical protein HC871_08780 [Rhizobiales bacterium]|nr:hypothetical protein [Hyphomicrobiales bacterium]
MKLLTFREAAKIGRCSATSVDRAVKSGALKVRERDGEQGFDRDEVRDWALRRWSPMEIAVALERLSILWSKTTALMAVELMIIDRSKVPFEEQVKPVRQCIRNFLFAFDQKPDDKYTYAEGVYFPQREQGGFDLPDDEWFKNEPGSRARYALFKFYRNGMFHFVDVMIQRGVLSESDRHKWLESPELHLDSLRSFEKLPSMSEAITSQSSA